MAKQKKNSGANIGYEAELWAMADALRGSMDAAEYKHVALGLIFLAGRLSVYGCPRESPFPTRFARQTPGIEPGLHQLLPHLSHDYPATGQRCAEGA